MRTKNSRPSIQQVMSESGVKFGTSGARGLVEAMTDRVCYTYTLAFLQHLETTGQFTEDHSVAIGGDLRPSTARITQAVAKAVTDFGLTAQNCGLLPSPALALHGIQEGIASIMVTGSHIPDDRNGIKFNTPLGEILKRDEASIRQQQVGIPAGLFDENGQFTNPPPMPAESNQALSSYLKRYLSTFSAKCLQGMRIGVYEHSGVARDLLGEIIAGLGAEIVRLGRSDSFVPVDTEAIRPEDIALAKQWVTEHRLDSIVSTDGDADRPLVSDEHGNWLRGDVAGVLCAKQLGIRNLATPVSCNSVVERSGWFDRVIRTRIGSPYVIEAMQQMLSAGERRVAGYEANGGFLIGDRIRIGESTLQPLPTRDAVIVILSILLLSVQRQRPISELPKLLPARFTASNRLQNFPTESSQELLHRLDPEQSGSLSMIEDMFASQFGKVERVNSTDGLRITFESGEIAHLRPSGNAPELRCYNEADTEERAKAMNLVCLKLLEKMR
ncbi:MAG: phosphomannomutase [Gammaproteobacteria bacterium]|nr:phosphomannomutase [Gammaproteobacteria bacterium]